MGFFDNLGNLFGFGNSNTSFNYQAQAPQFVSPEYLQSTEKQAEYMQGRPDTSSFAEALLKQSQDQQTAQANALAGSARGNVNPALLQRQVMRGASQAAGQTAGQVGVIRAQEALANRQLNDQSALAYRQLGQQAAAQQAQANLSTQGVNANLAGMNTQAQAGMFGGLINAAGGVAGKAAMASKGGEVTGQAHVDGDDEKNDTVPAMLSPGEIVIPRSKAEDPDKAKEFIDHLKGVKSKDSSGEYSKVLEAKDNLEKRVKELEELVKKKSNESVKMSKGGEVQPLNVEDQSILKGQQEKDVSNYYDLSPSQYLKAITDSSLPKNLVKNQQNYGLSEDQIKNIKQQYNKDVLNMTIKPSFIMKSW